MRRWRLPSRLSIRLRLPSSSGDETRSREETKLVERARGWPLVFIFVGRRAAAPRGPEQGNEASGRFSSLQASGRPQRCRSRGRT